MGTRRPNMVMNFQMPANTNGTAAGTCAKGYTLATSYGILATPTSGSAQMFGSIAHLANSSYVIPQQWAPTSDVHKITTSDGERMTECVQGFPKVTNGYTKA